eukprot:101803_1
MTGGEEVDQVDGGETSGDELGDLALGALELLEVLLLLLGVQLLQSGLHVGTKRDHGLAGLLVDPSLELGEPLVALAREVLLRHVHQKDSGLRGDEVNGVQELHLLVSPRTTADLLAGLEVGLDLVQVLQVHLLALIAATGKHRLVLGDQGVAGGDVLEHQLVEDDLQIAHRVDLTLNVDDVLILKHSAHVVDPVHLGDVTQKGVAETLTGGGTADQTGDIADLELGGHDGGGLVD